MYKFTDETTIKRLSDGAFIPVCEGNTDFQLFKADVVGIGTTCVVGIDTVITVCDNAKSTCPDFPSSKIRIHWSIEDPFNGWNDHEKYLEPYRIARNEIKEKINDLLQKDEINIV